MQLPDSVNIILVSFVVCTAVSEHGINLAIQSDAGFLHLGRIRHPGDKTADIGHRHIQDQRAKHRIAAKSDQCLAAEDLPGFLQQHLHSGISNHSSRDITEPGPAGITVGLMEIGARHHHGAYHNAAAEQGVKVAEGYGLGSGLRLA
ncbi:hypothetical protein D3C75_905260 [compost metagenome]